MRLLVATPVYGYQVIAGYTGSLLALRAKEQFDYIPLSGCFVDEGRNILAKMFLDRKYTHLLFWDADVEAPFPEEIVRMLHFAKKPEFGVIGAPYVRKQMEQEWTFETREQGDFDIDKPVPAKYVPTGLMVIRREVLQSVPFPWFETKRSESGFRGEDVTFCEKAQRYGVYLAPWVRTFHWGMWGFKGDLRGAEVGQV